MPLLLAVYSIVGQREPGKQLDEQQLWNRDNTVSYCYILLVLDDTTHKKLTMNVDLDQ